MRKNLTYGLRLSMLLLTFLFAGFTAYAQNVVLDEEWTPSNLNYQYTPPSDGVMTAQVVSGTINFQFHPMFYLNNGGTRGAAVNPNAGYVNNESASWDLKGGQPYYFYDGYDSSDVTWILTFTPGEVSGPQYPEMPFGEEFTGSNDVYEYTPEINETIYILTNSTADYSGGLGYMGGSLYTDPSHSGSSMIVMSNLGVNTELNGNRYSATLTGGTTYYLWARSGVKYICTFDAELGVDQGSDDNEAVELPLNTTFTPEADAYYLTADQDGILQVTYKTSPFDNCLYTQYENGSFSGNVAIASLNSDSGSNIYTWSLTSGLTYYLDTRYLKSNEVTAVFPYVEGGDDALITFVEPAPNSTFSGLMEGDVFRVKVNPSVEDQLVTLTYKITNDQSSQIIQNDLNKGTDGYWQRTIGIDYPFYEGATYTCLFQLYNSQMKNQNTLIGEQSITWYGNTRFPRSSVIFTGTNPPMDDILELNADGSANFSARFNGDVTVTSVYCPAGQGATSPCTFTQPTSQTVEVTVPASAVNTCLTNYGLLRVVIEATGSDGYPVYTDEVTESGELVRRAFVQVDFQTNKNVSNEVAFDVYTLDGDLLEGQAVKAPFSAVKISSTQSSQTINPSNVGLITITDTEANVVARGDYNSFEPGTNPTLNFNVAVTEPGEYILNFPVGAFVFGDGMQALSSAEQTVTFSIVGDEPSYEYMEAYGTVVDPVQSIVGSVGQIFVTWDEQNIYLKDGATAKWYVNSDFNDSELGELQDETPDLYLTTLATGDEGGIAQMAEDGENALVISLPFSAFFTKGVFNIVVPQATVENENGEVNAEQIITLFVVDVNQNDAIVEPKETGVSSLPEITVSFNDIMMIQPNEPMEIRLNQTVISTDELMTPIQSEDTGDISGYKFNVSSLTQENGTYEFVLPEGAFLLVGEDGKFSVNKEEFIEYTVTTVTGITDVVEALEGRYVVYNVNGILVLDTENAADLQGLSQGLYIINGKKVIVRN